MKNQSYKFPSKYISKKELKDNIEKNLMNYAIENYLRSKSRSSLIKLIKQNTNVKI